MVANFLHGGAAISVLAKLQGMELWIVDAGVAADCSAHPRLIDAKVRAGTRNFIEEPAMTPEECANALQLGSDVVGRVMPAAGNALVLGEMGIRQHSLRRHVDAWADRPSIDRLHRARDRPRRQGTRAKKAVVWDRRSGVAALPTDPLSLTGGIRRL